jgi:hypothetical protein
MSNYSFNPQPNYAQPGYIEPMQIFQPNFNYFYELFNQSPQNIINSIYFNPDFSEYWKKHYLMIKGSYSYIKEQKILFDCITKLNDLYFRMLPNLDDEISKLSSTKYIDQSERNQSKIKHLNDETLTSVIDQVDALSVAAHYSLNYMTDSEPPKVAIVNVANHESAGSGSSSQVEQYKLNDFLKENKCLFNKGRRFPHEDFLGDKLESLYEENVSLE